MKILVCGAGGFIGHHLVNKLKAEGHYVIGADLKAPAYENTRADKFYITDLRIQNNVKDLITEDIDFIYQLAADMGGAGFVFTGEHDADIMHNSASINLNIVNEMVEKGIKNVLYSSSACVYPEYCQTDSNCQALSEDMAYPAEPDSDYGLEKLFSERLYSSYARNYGLNVFIIRLHNVFGPLGSWNDGREKAPAALCRKIAESDGTIEVWGSGNQTRSFLYIDECLKGFDAIINAGWHDPINLGSEVRISINDFAKLIARIADKDIKIVNVEGPDGVAGRASDNTMIKKVTGWKPKENLEYGITQTYEWIKNEITRCN